MDMPVSLRSAIATCVAVLATVGCSPKPSDTASSGTTAKPDSGAAATAEIPVVTVTSKDFAFDAPAQVPAGLTTLHLINAGSQMHHVTLLRLAEGKTIADVGAVMKTEGPLPSWITFVGGPNPALPGGVADATVLLQPGNYVMMCMIPGPDNVPHVAKGMIRPLTVVAAASGPAPGEPKADIAMTLSDYTFSASPEVTAGPHVFRVTNTATQPHEVVLVKLAPGKKGADVLTWASKMAGPPPGEFQSGLTILSPGEQAYFPTTFAPGSYTWICFAPDAKDGKPHAMHGMVKDFTVS